jgi:hypothetical protein
MSYIAEGQMHSSSMSPSRMAEKAVTWYLLMSKPMTVPKKPGGQGHFHAVRFYKDADSLCRIVGSFLAEGLAAMQPAVAIATQSHRAGIVKYLIEHSLDVEALQKSGDLLLLDAEEVLAKFMVDGMPDPARFSDTVAPIIEKASRRRQDCVVRAYGEMVDVLWKAGHVAAATRLEMLWNGLARAQSFSLLCGYAMGNFYKDGAVEDICSHHSHVVSEVGTATAVN